MKTPIPIEMTTPNNIEMLGQLSITLKAVAQEDERKPTQTSKNAVDAVLLAIISLCNPICIYADEEDK